MLAFYLPQPKTGRGSLLAESSAEPPGFALPGEARVDP